jgi:presenilin-like A22 family membrane protease
MTTRSYLPLVGMFGLLFAVQLLALLLSQPIQDSGIVAFEDPSSVVNPIIFIGMLLVFTAGLLILIRIGGKRLLSLFITFAIFSTFIYIFWAIAVFILGVGTTTLIAALLASVAATLILYRYPEWYVIDTLGILIAAGAASIFGISLEILPVLILLTLLAVYDAIAVYKTKHMITLAEGVIETKSPILFVIPKSRSYSFVREGFSMADSGERGAYVMGMGDLIMPSILVVSANIYLRTAMIGPVSIPALGAIVGSMVGLAVLLYFVNSGRPQAGLPPLNGGTIAGFLIGSAIAGAWGWLPFL